MQHDESALRGLNGLMEIIQSIMAALEAQLAPPPPPPSLMARLRRMLTGRSAAEQFRRSVCLMLRTTLGLMTNGFKNRVLADLTARGAEGDAAPEVSARAPGRDAPASPEAREPRDATMARDGDANLDLFDDDLSDDDLSDEDWPDQEEWPDQEDWPNGEDWPDAGRMDSDTRRARGRHVSKPNLSNPETGHPALCRAEHCGPDASEAGAASRSAADDRRAATDAACDTRPDRGVPDAVDDAVSIAENDLAFVHRTTIGDAPAERATAGPSRRARWQETRGADPPCHPFFRADVVPLAHARL